MYPRPPIFAIFSVRDACGRRLRRSALSHAASWAAQAGLERQLGAFEGHAVSDARLGAMAEVRAAIPAST